MGDNPQDDDTLVSLAAIYQVLASAIRLRILDVASRRECYCEDLARGFGLGQSRASYHIKVLRDAGLLHAESRGTWVCYSVNHERLREMCHQIAGKCNAWLANAGAAPLECGPACGLPSGEPSP